MVQATVPHFRYLTFPEQNASLDWRPAETQLQHALPVSILVATVCGGGYHESVLTALQAIVERIVTGYDPDRIVVFGLRSSGEVREGSDIDLLIVKETPQRPLERQLEIERLLADRGVPLDLFVYTPAEMRQLYAAGNPLIEEIVENGRVIYMRKATQAWLVEAREELESASILFENHKLRGSCLHSQQCVEKALKALLLE
jgi:predicted nucleotidyltransferase